MCQNIYLNHPLSSPHHNAACYIKWTIPVVPMLFFLHRKTWIYEIQLRKSNFQKYLKCLETVSQVFAETVLTYPIAG